MENTVKITAADVNKLRQTTGAGMMDCKKALVEAGGDFEKAIEILRKKGQKVAANRADRESTEGAAIAKVNANNTVGVAIVLACETDFVGKNESFVSLANEFADLAFNYDSKEAFLEADFMFSIRGWKFISPSLGSNSLHLTQWEITGLALKFTSGSSSIFLILRPKLRAIQR